jgi:hypothetical protein
MNDFIDAPGRDADAFGKPVMADAGRLQKFRQKNFAYKTLSWLDIT